MNRIHFKSNDKTGDVDFSSEIAMPLYSTAEYVEPRRGLKTVSELCAPRGDKSIDFQTVSIKRILHVLTSSVVDSGSPLAYVKQRRFPSATLRLCDFALNLGIKTQRRKGAKAQRMERRESHFYSASFKKPLNPSESGTSRGGQNKVIRSNVQFVLKRLSGNSRCTHPSTLPENLVMARKIKPQRAQRIERVVIFILRPLSRLSVSSVVFRNLKSKISKSLRGFGHCNARCQRPAKKQHQQTTNALQTWMLSHHYNLLFPTVSVVDGISPHVCSNRGRQHHTFLVSAPLRLCVKL